MVAAATVQIVHQLQESPNFGFPGEERSRPYRSAGHASSRHLTRRIGTAKVPGDDVNRTGLLDLRCADVAAVEVGFEPVPIGFADQVQHVLEHELAGFGVTRFRPH